MDITESFREKKEWLPFRQLAQETDMIMMGHLFHREFDPFWPASLSQVFYRILREDMRFDGVILTDDLQMDGAYTGSVGQGQALSTRHLVLQALEAGSDLLLLANIARYEPRVGAKAVRWIVEAVRKGKLPFKRLKNAYIRVKRLRDKVMRRVLR